MRIRALTRCQPLQAHTERPEKEDPESWSSFFMPPFKWQDLAGREQLFMRILGYMAYNYLEGLHMKSQGTLIAAFAFALVVAIFAVINVSSVEVNFLFAKTSTPLILVILVSTLLGGLSVGLFGMFKIFKLQRTIKTLEKRAAGLEAAAEPFEASFAATSFAGGKASVSDNEAEADNTASASSTTDEVK